MANANLNYLSAFNQGGPSGAMDASSASGAQLAALAGINMGGNNNMQNQAANNMLLGNRQSNQNQMPAQQMQQAVGQMGQSNNAALLQQQIAQLQRQLEQQNQGGQSQNQAMVGMSGAMGGMAGQRRASTSGQNFGGMPSQQQQLLQQMQQMGGNSDQFSSMAAMMQGQNATQMQQQQQQQQQRSQLGGNLGGLNNQQDLLLQQQQQLMRTQGMQQQQPNSIQNDMFSTNQNQSSSNSNDMMGGRGRSSQMMQMEQLNQSMNSQSQSQNNSNALGKPFNNFDMDGSTNSRTSRQQGNNQGISPLDIGNNPVGDSSNKDDATNQKSFLDGSFAGGWQSNADLPDRRRIIFSILEVIRQMRPDTNKISQKLPHMAKSLEEHLYRSAQTKEEYLDPSTLKKRLQLIAHGLELHRSTTSSDQGGNDQSGSNSIGNIPSESQQLQQYLQMQGGNVNLNQGSNAVSRNSITSLGGLSSVGGNNRGGMDDVSLQGSLGGGNFGGTGSSGLDDLNDPVAQQKKKVIRQQQQRLLLLRHASKCKEGPNCKTKFCPQMMALWKHMKKCRDKNCKTPHCLSSRCVLNHYRICKSQGRTSACEVCGPVMEQIKLSEQLDSSDPLAAKPQTDMPQLQQQISNFGNPQQQQPQQQQTQLNNIAQARQQQAMQQLYQKQHQAIQQSQNQQVPNLMGMQNNMQNSMQNSMQNDMSNNIQNPMQNSMDVLHSLGGGGMGSSDLQGSQNSNQLQQQQPNQGNQQQNQQNLQQKLEQQQHVLRQLQKQQANLLEQQQQLQQQQQDPGTQQGQQLQQQSLLLQQLQRRCQQEQAVIQQELLVTMKGMQGGQQGNQALGNSNQTSQLLGNSSQNSHNSQQNQMGMQGGNSQSNQMNVQAQMQALSQSHLDAVNTNSKGNDNMSQMDSLQNQLNSDPLKNDLLNQPLPDEGPDGNDKDQDLVQEKPSDITGSSSTDPFDSMGPLVTDTSENKEESSSSAPKIRSATTLSRGKGARGRGGKGKRLRDIADDLLPAESAAVVRAGGSIAIPSDSSRKRSAGDDADDGPASKSQKTDANKDGADLNPSLTSSMPKGDVEQNLMMLHKGLHLTSRTITHKCLPIVQQLIDDPYGWVFRDAVDPVVFGLPDYFEVVKNPMHLLLVKKKLENAVYTDMASFERDVKLVFENSILYNGEDSEVGQLAHTMMGVFEKEYQKVCEGM
ncbi:MAG: hypothetical protein SGBAC_000869 [Bacillariaceae sp.]